MFDSSFIEFCRFVYDDDLYDIETINTNLSTFSSFYNGGCIYVPYMPDLKELIINPDIEEVQIDSRNDCYINNPADVRITYL